MSTLKIAAPLVLALVAAGAQAQQAPAPARHASATAASTMATGEILEVDRKEKRVLVKHGPIQSIGMDAMTMEFAVPDAALLKQLKPGDRIQFAVVWRQGDYEITRAKVTSRKAVKP